MPGARGHLRRHGRQRYNSTLAADAPRLRAVRPTTSTPPGSRKALCPDLPRRAASCTPGPSPRALRSVLDAPRRRAATRAGRVRRGGSWCRCPTPCAASTCPGHDGRRRHRGEHRLRYEEAFVLQVTLAQRRRASGGAVDHAAPSAPGRPARGLRRAAAVQLTAGQVEVGAQIARRAGPRRARCTGCCRARSARARPSSRCAPCSPRVDSGGQAALLAPTEVLAAQHHRTITRDARRPRRGRHARRQPSIGTRVALLTGSQSTADAAAPCSTSPRGDAGIVVGTHALLQENVDFFDLGLVVVDEQHRFGVEQRDALRGKGTMPPARAGDDRHADPAHRRDDRVR